MYICVRIDFSRMHLTINHVVLLSCIRDVSAVIAILVSIGVTEYVRPVAVAGLTRVRMSIGSTSKISCCCGYK